MPAPLKVRVTRRLEGETAEIVKALAPGLKTMLLTAMSGATETAV